MAIWNVFTKKVEKTFLKTSVGLMLFPLHLGYFISHWITNQILLTKLQHRPLTHNYVVWIMAVCMTYKHLGSTCFFSFMCLKETEKINGICLGIVGEGRQCPSIYELRAGKYVFVFTKRLQYSFTLHPLSWFYMKYFDMWYIVTDFWWMLLWLYRRAFCYQCWNLKKQKAIMQMWWSCRQIILK